MPTLYVPYALLNTLHLLNLDAYRDYFVTKKRIFRQKVTIISTG